MSKQVIVIGGGVGGLSAAIRLAAKGLRVTLLEKNDRIGGKLNLRELPHPGRPADRSFRFDTGPSLLTLPFVFEQLFEAAGTRLSNHLTLQRLDPIARYIWGDGTTFELRNDDDALEQELRKIAPDDVAGYRAFAAEGKRIWDLSAELFLFKAPEQLLKPRPGSPADTADALAAAADPLFRAKVGLKLLSTPFQIGMFRRFSVVVDRAVRSRRLREVLYQYATYSGASPFKAPATLTCIPHAERQFGGWYPQGGMYRLAEALAEVAQSLGVDIRTSSPVDQVLIEPPTAGAKSRRIGRAAGVRLADGEAIRADAVVCNADVVYSYRSLIESRYRRKYADKTLNKLEAGGSGLALLLGVEGTYPQLAHHNKFMPADYRSDVVSMFHTRTVPRDPAIYVCATTRTDASQAPDDCENLFVLASAPPIDGTIDWSTRGPRYRDQLINSLEHAWGLKDLNKRIVVERQISPADLKSLYNANAGSIYGIGSNNLKDAFLRPPNRDKDVERLYFAGGATHPGGGLPLVALSGKIASEMVMEDLDG
ncbi:phytoene desaturase family protein [Humisphaera borealis]|uniref:Phytoene desaturase n=1 Tax=Humisphaera borealis TaxID=2807512 RepID=A0A7M2WXH7_9BACT|nr:phytoene desaturase family protein [Humisphaera borealis]QOV90054.1 phytoene desaturase [Humisphaera borealis]